MFPIEAGKIERKDRIIPSLSGKILYYLTESAFIGAFPVIRAVQICHIYLVLVGEMNWVFGILPWGRLCVNLLLFLELTELCKRVWQSHNNQTAGIRTILKRRNHADTHFHFAFLSDLCIISLKLLLLLLCVWRFINSQKSVLRSEGPSLRVLLYLQVHNFLFPFNFPHTCSTLTAKKKHDLLLWKEREVTLMQQLLA